MKLLQKQNIVDTKLVYQSFPFPNCSSTSSTCGTPPALNTIYADTYSTSLSLVNVPDNTGPNSGDFYVKVDPTAYTPATYNRVVEDLSSGVSKQVCLDSYDFCVDIVGANVTLVPFDATYPIISPVSPIVGGVAGDSFIVGSDSTGNTGNKYQMGIYTTKGAFISFQKSTALINSAITNTPALNIYNPSGTAGAPSYTVTALPVALQNALSFVPQMSGAVFSPPASGSWSYPLYYYYAKPDIMVIVGHNGSGGATTTQKVTVINTSTAVPTLLSSTILPSGIAPAVNYHMDELVLPFLNSGLSTVNGYLQFNATYTTATYIVSATVPPVVNPAHYYVSSCGSKRFGIVSSTMDNGSTYTLLSPQYVNTSLITSTIQNVPILAPYTTVSTVAGFQNGGVNTFSVNYYLSTRNFFRLTREGYSHGPAVSTPITPVAGNVRVVRGFVSGVWTDYTNSVQVYGHYFGVSYGSGTNTLQVIGAETAPKPSTIIDVDININGSNIVPAIAQTAGVGTRTSNMVTLTPQNSIDCCYTFKNCSPAGVMSVDMHHFDQNIGILYTK